MTNNCELRRQSRILSPESLLEEQLNSFDVLGYSFCSCSLCFSGARERVSYMKAFKITSHFQIKMFQNTCRNIL